MIINDREEFSKRLELYDGEIRDFEKSFKETRTDLQHAREHGGIIFFDFNGKEAALDTLYDIFHYVPTALASISCFYKAEDGRSQVSILTDLDSDSDRIKDKIKYLMNMSGADYCVLERSYGKGNEVSNDTYLSWNKDYPNGLFFETRNDYPYNNDEEHVASLLLIKQETTLQGMKQWHSALKNSALKDDLDSSRNKVFYSYKFKGKQEALDALYDIFKDEVFSNPRLVFFYPPETDKKPLEILEKEKISREKMHDMMGSGEFGMCSVSGFDDEEHIMSYSIFWSGYSDCEPDELTIIGYDDLVPSNDELLKYLEIVLGAVMLRSWQRDAGELP